MINALEEFVILNCPSQTEAVKAQKESDFVDRQYVVIPGDQLMNQKPFLSSKIESNH